MPNVSYANLVVGFVWKHKAAKGHVHVHNFWLVYYLSIMKKNPNYCFIVYSS
jgi:hypothetical protein